MAIIIISSTSAALRKEVSESLARKLGYPCLSREELTDQATAAGIPVGKLEMSIVKGPGQTERLARLKERYLAFITAGICEQAGEGNLVYHGRGGHFLMPNVAHIFRVRLVANKEYRIQTKMRQLRLDRPKTEKFIEQVDQDIETWVHLIHGQDINDPRQYDLILNLENMSLPNTSAALCSLAELPDFRPTPASTKSMDNYCLASRAKLKLALDSRTADSDLTVSANEGVITVTYMPRQAQVASHIPAVLAEVKGVKEVLATMAETNILWIQEAYNPQAETFLQINQIAQRWGAAIELLRFLPSEEMVPEAAEDETGLSSGTATKSREYTGGIEEDVPEPPRVEDGGLNTALEELIRQGRSGGSRFVQGNFQALSSVISRNVNYSLVVIGDLFLSKPKAARTRMLRDLKVYLGGRIRVPVISSDELQEKYFLGGKEIIKSLVFVVLLAGMFWGVFSHQETVMKIIQDYKGWKMLSMLGIGIFAPLFAYFYGTVAHIFLKIIKFD